MDDLQMRQRLQALRDFVLALDARVDYLWALREHDLASEFERTREAIVRSIKALERAAGGGEHGQEIETLKR